MYNLKVGPAFVEVTGFSAAQPNPNHRFGSEPRIRAETHVNALVCWFERESVTAGLLFNMYIYIYICSMAGLV